MIYENEEQVGEAIKASGVPRKEIFLTSKLWLSDYQHVLQAAEESLRKLQTEYLDLYLVHWPSDNVPIEGIMKYLNQLVRQGKVRDIGVSNFSACLWREAQVVSEVPLVNNQVECHPLLHQEKLQQFVREKNLVLTAYSPLGRGECLNHPIIQAIAKKYQRSPAQVCLRWLIERNCVVIPKATSPDHIKDNLLVLRWQMDKEDVEKIDGITEEQRIVDFDFCRWDEWE